MRVRRISWIFAVLLALAGCGGGKPPEGTGAAGPAASPAATAGSQAPAADATPGSGAAPADASGASGDLATVLATADPARGKILFLQCRACHSLQPEAEPGKIGPTLYGVIGRVAGTAHGFAYSDAVARSGITWTPEQIDRWLQRPSEFLPGNKMVFVGIQEPKDRANIIAFIQQESAKPAAP